MKFEFFNARYNDWQMARRDFCITIGRLLEPNELFTIASEGLQPLADAPVILKQYGKSNRTQNAIMAPDLHSILFACNKSIIQTVCRAK